MAVHYKHTQKGSSLLIGLCLVPLVVIAIVSVLVFRDFQNQKMPDGEFYLFTTIMSFTILVLIWAVWMMSSLTVEIDDEKIKLKYGNSAFRKTFKIGDIQSACSVRNNWVCGWGIHYYGKGWLYNVAGLDAIEIIFKNGKQARIGTDEPNELVEMINKIVIR